MSNEPVLQVRLTASYGVTTVLRDLALTLAPGEALGLVGTSGAGKSTLVLALLGLLPWRGGKVTGEVLLNGQNLLALPEKSVRNLRGKHIALIPQSPMSALNPAITLRAHFLEAWNAHATGGGPALSQRLSALLPQCQLPADPAFLARRPGQISVGQAQRVLIALALLHRPAVVMADEPTSALDPVTQSEIIALLRSIVRTTGAALLYVSHDLISVLQLCDRIAVLHGGTLVETLPVAKFDLCEHPAARALLNSLPGPAGVFVPRAPSSTTNG